MCIVTLTNMYNTTKDERMRAEADYSTVITV